MKKLAYIILVVAILVVISHFVKQGNVNQPTIVEETAIIETEAATPSADEVPNIEENAATPATENAAPINTPAEDNDVVDVQENVEDIIIEDKAPEDDGAVEVEETNPENTVDEEETIIKE